MGATNKTHALRISPVGRCDTMRSIRSWAAPTLFAETSRVRAKQLFVCLFVVAVPYFPVLVATARKRPGLLFFRFYVVRDAQPSSTVFIHSYTRKVMLIEGTTLR